MADKKNILILMTDQHRADCLSCAGHPIVQTPNIDRLAANGTRFSGAYTTSPVCMPARSSFLSGLYCHNHGQWTNAGRFDPTLDTYLHHAKRAGYRTAHIGKSHFYPHHRGEHLNDYLPYMRQLGLDDVLEVTGPLATEVTDSIMTDHWREIGCLDTFRNDYRKRHQVGPVKATWPSPMPPGETLDDFVGKTAVDYLAEYDRNEPLLAFVGFGGPHSPWDPPSDWAKRYDPEQMDAAKPAVEPPPWVPPEAAEHQRRLNAEFEISTEDSAKIRALYYAKINHIDWWIGRIIDVLGERGMLENTHIIFWSDHGEMLCDKQRLGKSVFFEESACVPLIVRLAGSNGGAVCDRLVSQIDVFPTILELAGCEPSSQQFGQPLMPLLDDPSARHRDAVFSEIDNRTMIRTERWKMVVDDGGTALKLYDMIDDPAEEQNLAGKAEAERTIAALRERLLQWHLATQLHQPYRRR